MKHFEKQLLLHSKIPSNSRFESCISNSFYGDVLCI